MKVTATVDRCMQEIGQSLMFAGRQEKVEIIEELHNRIDNYRRIYGMPAAVKTDHVDAVKSDFSAARVMFKFKDKLTKWASLIWHH